MVDQRKSKFGIQMDISERQREIEQSRKVDGQDTQRRLSELVQNEENILQVSGVVSAMCASGDPSWKELRQHKIQMQEAVISIQKVGYRHNSCY